MVKHCERMLLLLSFSYRLNVSKSASKPRETNDSYEKKSLNILN